MEAIEQKSYQYNSDQVFTVLLEVLDKNYEVKRIEHAIRTVEISTGISLFSFGENFEIIVANNGNGSVVRIKAKSKVRWNATSEVGSKAKNIFKLLDENLI